MLVLLVLGFFWDRDFSRLGLTNCDAFNDINSIYGTTSGRDFLLMSKESSCWQEKFTLAIQSSISEINKMERLVNQLNSELKLYFICDPWAFKHETTIGHAHFHYRFPNEIEITSLWLVNFINDQTSENVNIIDLEPLFHKYISDQEGQCFECSNKFYFPNDGHWNHYSHEIISDYLEPLLVN